MNFWRYGVWLLALGLGGWTLLQLPLGDIGTAIEGLGFTGWLCWLALNVSILALATQRWRLLVRALRGHVAWLRLFAVRQAGQAVSFITPGPQFGGEPLQVYWLCRGGKGDVSMTGDTALVSLLLDRLFELFTNFGVLVLGIGLLMFSPLVAVAAWPQLLVAVAALFLGAGGLAVGVLSPPSWLGRVNRRLATRIPSAFKQHQLLQTFARHWQRGQKALARLASEGKTRLFTALVVSLVTWILLLAETYLLLNFVGIEPNIQGFVLLVVGQRLAMLLPVPGGIGTVEAAVVWVFAILSWSAGAALGFIALMRLRDGVLLLLGLYLMRRLQLATGGLNPPGQKPRTSAGKRPSS